MRRLTVAVVLIGTVLAACSSDSTDTSARLKAEELHARAERQGIDIADTDVLVGVYGDDGGAVCVAADSTIPWYVNLQAYQSPGLLQPGRFFEETIEGDRLTIEVYCPEKLPDFDERVDELRLEEGSPP